jgi:hypothetical protein
MVGCISLDLSREWSSTGQGLHDIDLAMSGEWIAQGSSVFYHFAVDENIHVFAQDALFVEDIASDARIPVFHFVKDIGKGAAAGDGILQTGEEPF